MNIAILAALLLLAPALHAQTPAANPVCGDSAVAAEYTLYATSSFAGDDEETVELRRQFRLRHIDPAEVGPVTDPAVCAAVQDAVDRHMAGRVSYRYRLVITRMGRYYAVALQDQTPPPPGLVIEGRELVVILAARTLKVLHDNFLY